ncbi:energy transducer TonB [Psychrobacter sp. AOP7-B1-24]|uniref:energy transducer TonB n=1 Tax=Psychrobacter sp. AOP7-B1-24 TaxID=3457645 RepID=UPI00402B9F9D
MSSTNLDAPSPKLTLATIAIVVGLHALTAVALASVKTPEMKVEPEKVTPPIEIELVTPPPPPVEIEEVNLKEDPEPVREVKTKPKAKPVAAPKPKVVKKKQPVEKPKPAKFTPPPAPQKTAPQKNTKTQVADDQRKLLAAKAEQARRDALLAEQQRAQADADAKAAQVQAAADAKRAQEIADAKAAADAAAAQKAKEAEAAAAAANNTPVQFTANSASWASKPNFEFPKRAASSARPGATFNVVLKMTVNKQGVISNVRVARSSENRAVDNAAKRQVTSGRFKPFTENGVPRVGNVTFTVSYKVPK